MQPLDLADLQILQAKCQLALYLGIPGCQDAFSAKYFQYAL